MNQTLRPLDLGKLDFEGNRKRRRKKLLIRLSPILAGLVMIIVWLLLPFIATEQAILASKAANYSAASNWLDALGTNNLFETYKRPFNQGIVATNQKKFDIAADHLKQSISLAPNEIKCSIRIQLVLSNELAGDDALTRKDRQAAIQYYTRALSDITTHKDCFQDQSALSMRIALKLAELYNAIKQDTYQDKTETPDTARTNTESPTDKQLEELQRLQQQGQQAVQEESRKLKSDYTYTGKQW